VLVTLAAVAACAPAAGAATSRLGRQGERAILRGVPSLAAQHRLLSRFVDPSSGLTKSNVQVTCSRRGRTGLGCLLRASPRQRTGQLYLSYRIQRGQLTLRRVEHASGASRRWPRHLPASRAVPSVTGQAVTGSTLRAGPGAWRDKPAVLAYDWLRCDAHGHACSSASQGRARAIGTADAGAALRVSVIASNRHGSTIAVSSPTPAVGSPGTVPGSPAPSVPAPPPWFVGDFENGNLSQWPYLGDAHGVSVVSSPTSGPGSRYAAKAETTDTPDSSTTGDASYVESGSFDLPWENNGADAWFSMAVLLPSGTNPAYPGTFTPSPSSGWNMFMEWHVSPGIGGSSPYVGVRNSAGAPRLVFRLAGGQVGSPQIRWVDDPQPLEFDHWYQIAVRMKWSPDPSQGYAEWWVDGVRKFAGSFPTLYRRSDGSASSVMFDTGHYRGTQSWTDTVYFDGIKVGPQLGSVMP
jgi:hypothetical protein